MSPGGPSDLTRVLRRSLLCATALTGLSVPFGGAAVANDVTISGPVTGYVYGNSSTSPYTTADQAATGNTLSINSGATISFGGCCRRLRRLRRRHEQHHHAQRRGDPQR